MKNEKVYKLSWENAVKHHCKNTVDTNFVKDCYFDDDVLAAAVRYEQSTEWTEVAKLFQSCNGTALDVGAGRGIASYSMIKAGFEVFALEPDNGSFIGRGAIANLNKHMSKKIKIVDGYTENLPFEDNYFDIIFGRAVLHHMSDLPKAMSELSRVLKPGGLIVAAREHVISKENDLEKFFQVHPLHKFYGGEYAYTLHHYLTVFENSGLEITEIIRPLKSNINTAPKTVESVVSEIINTILPSRFFKKRILLKHQKYVYLTSLLTSIAELFDNRPGRLYSFVLRKPLK